MMDKLLSWFIDFSFYSMIEAAIFFVFTMIYSGNTDKIKLPNLLKHIIGISFVTSVTSGFVQIMGITQLLIVLCICTYIALVVKPQNLKKSMIAIVVMAVVFVFIEMVFNFLILKPFINIFSLYLNNIFRLSAFVFYKIIEVLIAYAYLKKVKKMKLATGGVTRR